MRASTATVSSTTERSPTRVSVRRVLGPITHSSPTRVVPHSIVWGSSSVSRPTSTSGPTHTWSGSSMVTPASMSSPLMRRCMTRVASASWRREFTPSSSEQSQHGIEETGWPSSRKMETMSVR